MKGGQRRDTYSLAQENLKCGFAYCIWKIWKKNGYENNIYFY